MESWETPALTGYFYEEFPSKTTRRCLLLRKKRNKAKYLTWYSIRPKFVKKTSIPNFVESLGYIQCYSSSCPRPVKSSSDSIRHNFRRSAVDGEDVKSYWKSENLIIYKFFKGFTNHRKKTNRTVVFSSRPFPNILKYRDHQWDLSTIWKTRLFQTHIEEFS